MNVIERYQTLAEQKKWAEARAAMFDLTDKYVKLSQRG